MKRFSVGLIFGAIFMSMMFVACGGGGGGVGHGGGGGGTPGVVAKAIAWVGTPTFQITKKTTTASNQGMNFGLVPAANAATAIPNLTGSYSGFCLLTPADRFTLGSQTEFVIFGLGRWDTSDCSNNFVSATTSGAPIIGTGTLGSLVVVAQCVACNHADSGLVKLYTNPGAVFTGISCALGAGEALPDGQKRCLELVTTAAAADGGNAFATMTVYPDDRIHNIRVAFTKQ